MTSLDFEGQVLETWRMNHDVTLRLLTAVPRKGLLLTQGSAARHTRTLAQVFGHIHHVRVAWLRYMSPGHATGLPRFPAGFVPTRRALRSALISSGNAIATFLGDALNDRATVKSFSRQPVRFMGYLISHESHHRGQIAMLLRQAGMCLPDEVAIRSLWQRWYWRQKTSS